jgi:hypothetical protein
MSETRILIRFLRIYFPRISEFGPASEFGGGGFEPPTPLDTPLEITYSWFQQDGAIAHTAYNSINVLNEIFGERVISRNLCPSRSSDLTPPEFYLWGAAKSCIVIANARLLS